MTTSVPRVTHSVLVRSIASLVSAASFTVALAVALLLLDRWLSRSPIDRPLIHIVLLVFFANVVAVELFIFTARQRRR